jgi:hypothetical protein
MDVGGWLRSLDLGQYETVFRENAIDASVLHDLTEDQNTATPCRLLGLSQSPTFDVCSQPTMFPLPITLGNRVH